MDQEQMKAYLDHCYGVVQRTGWLVQGVVPAVGEPWTTPFYYTAGLTIRKLPEVVLSCGLDPTICTDLVNQIAKQFIDAGHPLPPGTMLAFDQPHSKLMPVMPIRLAALDPVWVDENVTAPERLGFGMPSALQMLWPDRHGRFPGDEGYSMNPDVQKTFPPVSPKALPAGNFQG